MTPEREKEIRERRHSNHVPADPQSGERVNPETNFEHRLWLVLTDPGSAGVFYATAEARAEVEAAIRGVFERLDTLKHLAGRRADANRGKAE